MSYFDDLLERRADSEKEEAKEYKASYGWWEPCANEVDEAEAEYVERQRAGSLIACAQSLENAQAEVHQQNLWSAQLYSNRELAAFDWGNGYMARASLAPISRTGENITMRVVDTLVSQIGKNRPKAKPQARGASFRVRQSIRKLDKYLYGEWQRNRLYATTKQTFRDACVFGFGCTKIGVEDSDDHGARVTYERVFPDEVLVDQMEIVATGKIRHFYRRRVLPIEVVAETYGVDEATLKADGNAGFSYLDYRPVGKGWVVVIEGYQLACGRSPGRWMVATNRRVLDEGTWDHTWLPYVFYNYNEPLSGFYPPSVVEQCLPYQIRLNEINEVIRDAQDLMGRPRVLVAEGSRVNPMEVDNVIGRFIKYTGIKPEAITWTAINAELYNERDRLIAQCLEQFGVSRMSSGSVAPQGARFDSSKAFREFNAIQDDRLSDPAQRYEEYHLELASRTIDVIAASGHNPKTYWYSGWKKAKCEEIDWESIAHEADSYVMTMEAVSIFSMSPAAATDELEKQLAMGLITPEQYRMELSDMDNESAYSLQAAAAEDLNRVQMLLEAGEFENPTPQQDLVSGITQMTLAGLALKKYEDDDPSISLADVQLNIVNWVTLAQAIVEQGTTKTSATMPTPEDQAMAQGGMMPQGQPAPDPLAAMGPATVPVPEAAGLAVANPGRAPAIH